MPGIMKSKIRQLRKYCSKVTNKKLKFMRSEQNQFPYFLVSDELQNITQK